MGLIRHSLRWNIFSLLIQFLSHVAFRILRFNLLLKIDEDLGVINESSWVSFFGSLVQTTIRKYFFSRSVINNWNSLPLKVVNAASLDSFKKKLDNPWEDKICFNTRRTVETSKKYNIQLV